MGVMIYDKDLKLVNIVNPNKMQYLVDNQTKEKFIELQRVFVSKDSLYLYGHTTENTIIETYNKNKDVILMIDTSGSMFGDKLQKLKYNSIEFDNNIAINTTLFEH